MVVVFLLLAWLVVVALALPLCTLVAQARAERRLSGRPTRPVVVRLSLDA